MVATFTLNVDYGGTDAAPGSSPTWTNLRFRTDDLNTQDLTNPVPIVAGLVKYSYARAVYVKCSAAPDTQVDNFKTYTDGGGFGTGIVTSYRTTFPTKNSGSSSGYIAATGTPGDTGTELVSLYGGAKADLFGKTSGSPLTGPTISEAGSIINDIGETTNYLILQCAVNGDTAAPGLKTAETITFQYDEI